MKKILAVIAILLISVLFFFAPAANAATVSNVNVVRVSVFAGASASYVYFRSSGLDNTYNYCTTSDAKLIDAATQSLTGPWKVQIVTSASCNTGTNSSCGTCTTIRINP